MNYIIDYKPKLIIPGGCSECQEDGTETQWPGSWNRIDKYKYYNTSTSDVGIVTMGYPPHHVAPLAHAGAPLYAVCAQQVVLGLPPPLKLGDGLHPPRRHHHHHYHGYHHHGQCCHVVTVLWLQYEISQSQHLLLTSFIFNHLSTSANIGIFTKIMSLWYHLYSISHQGIWP